MQALVPAPAWFSDDLSTALIDRDSKESLTGKWIVELAEFPHIRREVEKVKAFFSRQADRFRRAYDRANRDWPRQCAFIASTNELEFIDVTGNRRFWPIPLASPADIGAIERDREQLWAEAVDLYRQGFQWWLTPSLEAIAVKMQDAATQDIARFTVDAGKITAEVAQNIESVSHKAVEAGSAAEQALSSAQMLSQESNKLKSEIEKFLAAVRAA